MKENKENFINLLSKIYSRKEIESLKIYLSNPAKYPQIISILKKIQIGINEKKEYFTPEEFKALWESIDDELALAILIRQESKCDPFKFIKF